MKVKVSYTVDLEDIPGLVQEILASVKRDVSDCTSRLIFDPNNFNKMVENCRVAREKLDVVDSQIQDVVNITLGWLDAIQPESEAEPSTKEEEVSHDEGAV